MYDPFIDDSELIEMIDNQHDQVKTVHEGFFVNSGELKVVNHESGAIFSSWITVIGNSK